MPTIVLPRVEALAETNPELYEIFRELKDELNQTQPSFLSGFQPPESLVAAQPGTVYVQRLPQSGPTMLHVKDTGTGNTGWAKLGAFGSIPPTAGGGFQAIATPTTVTFYYDGTSGSSIITLYRSDGSQVQIPSSRTVVTGLLPNTTYFFYPYYDERSKALQWVAGNAGNPAIANTTDNSNSAQQARLAHHIPLTAGTSISVTTPNAGSSLSSVGGGFGGRGRLA